MLDRPALPADGRPRYVLDIEPVSRTVTVGPRDALDVREIVAERPVWTGCEPLPGPRGFTAHHGPTGDDGRCAFRYIKDVCLFIMNFDLAGGGAPVSMIKAVVPASSRSKPVCGMLAIGVPWVSS